LKPDRVFGVNRVARAIMGAYMAGQVRLTELDDLSLMAVFDAAWAVIGREAYAFDQEDRDRLQCDLALQIARLVASGVNDDRELVRRSILRFLH
jgi:hypothetical protein